VSSADNPSSPERPTPLSANEVAELVRRILNEGGRIIPTWHFAKRGVKRDFTTQDAMEVLLTGSVRSLALWNEECENWNHDVDGQDLDGEALTVRIAFTSDQDGIILVTGF